MNGSKSHKHMKAELVLGDLTGKVSKESDIAQSERALVNLDTGALYFPVLLNEIVVGGVFLGSGQFIVDAIVETRKGAIGKSEEHNWDGNLLLLNQGGMWSAPSTVPLKDSDLKTHNLESAEEAKERAQRVFDRLTYEDKSVSLDFFESKEKGWIVKVINNENKESSLVAKGDRLVMTHKGTNLVLKGNKLVRKEGKKTLIIGEKGNTVRVG